MKTALIVSFDIRKKGEGEIPLSVGSILARLKNEPGYGAEFEADHLSINMSGGSITEGDFEPVMQQINLNCYDFIAVSCFIWNEYLVNPFIRFLRSRGYSKKIVLGGGQITYGDRSSLCYEYPGADIFISGYAEKSFVDILKAGEPEKTFYNLIPDFSQMPSPYLDGTMQLREGQEMIRWETMRGCPYKCNFCAHRDLQHGKVHLLKIEKAFQELELFRKKKIGKINILDPVFNAGKTYMEILREIERLGFGETTFSLQAKMELMAKKDGDEFLERVAQNKMHLEFGIQTLIPEEYEVITRRNNVSEIMKQLSRLKERNISYEVSLIYGLPNQTPDSFRKSIDILKEAGCSSIAAWPLMLLKGTSLFEQRRNWSLKEEIIGNFNIPVVTSGNSFDRDEWQQMHELAETLHPNQRVK